MLNLPCFWLKKSSSIYVHMQKGFKVDSMLQFLHNVHFAPTPRKKNLTFLMAHKGALEHKEKQQTSWRKSPLCFNITSLI